MAGTNLLWSKNLTYLLRLLSSKLNQQRYILGPEQNGLLKLALDAGEIGPEKREGILPARKDSHFVRRQKYDHH